MSSDCIMYEHVNVYHIITHLYKVAELFSGHHCFGEFFRGGFVGVLSGGRVRPFPTIHPEVGFFLPATIL